jgi:Family of unknown function (DUF5677)
VVNTTKHLHQPSAVLQSALDESIKKLPAIALAKVLAPKLKSAGVRRYKKVASDLAEHITKNGAEPFQWGTGTVTSNVAISFDDADIVELERITQNTIEKLPDIIERLSREMSWMMVERYVAEWKQARYLEERDIRFFRDDLERQWGGSLDALRILLTACEQGCQLAVERHNRSKARKGRPTKSVLIRLHARACQVTAEILTLLENGFADGAIARWRTLHEISIVALVISDGGDELARAYNDHEIVEIKRAHDRYIIDHETLGLSAPTKRESARIDRQYQMAVQKYGSAFGTEYGWAASYLKLKRPRFIDLQDTAKRIEMHSYYKMASYNVHASSRGLTHRMTDGFDNHGLITGFSNAGLEEPGVQTAVSLTLITSAAVDYGRSAIDQAVYLRALMTMRDEALAQFSEAATSLKNFNKMIRDAELSL